MVYSSMICDSMVYYRILSEPLGELNFCWLPNLTHMKRLVFSFMVVGTEGDEEQTEMQNRGRCR